MMRLAIFAEVKKAISNAPPGPATDTQTPKNLPHPIENDTLLEKTDTGKYELINKKRGAFQEWVRANRKEFNNHTLSTDLVDTWLEHGYKNRETLDKTVQHY